MRARMASCAILLFLLLPILTNIDARSLQIRSSTYFFCAPRSKNKKMAWIMDALGGWRRASCACFISPSSSPSLSDLSKAKAGWEQRPMGRTHETNPVQCSTGPCAECVRSACAFEAPDDRAIIQPRDQRVGGCMCASQRAGGSDGRQGHRSIDRSYVCMYARLSSFLPSQLKGLRCLNRDMYE